MAAVSTEWRFCRRFRVASVGLMALCVLITPAAADARKGATVADTAKYRYKVTSFDYNALGDVVATRDPGGPGVCEPVEDADWIGHVATTPSFVSNLGDPGKGSLKIHNHGSSGNLEATLAVESDFGPAEHTEVTSCDHDPSSPHYQQQTDSTTTQCTDHSESEVQASIEIAGGVGDRVRLVWSFFLPGVGDWVPNTFNCNGPFHYPVKACKSKAPLSQFTKKNVKLTFFCRADSTAPPPVGINYTTYVSGAQVSGSLELKRTKQS